MYTTASFKYVYNYNVLRYTEMSLGSKFKNKTLSLYVYSEQASSCGQDILQIMDFVKTWVPKNPERFKSTIAKIWMP